MTFTKLGIFMRERKQITFKKSIFPDSAKCLQVCLLAFDCFRQDLKIIDISCNFRMKWKKVFKNGPSKICGRQPLKNLNWYVFLSRSYRFKFFKGYLPQILLGPFLNTLSHETLLILIKRSFSRIPKMLIIKFLVDHKVLKDCVGQAQNGRNDLQK